MRRTTPIRMTEQFQHFLEDLKKSFEGDLYGYTRQAGKRFCDQQSLRERASYLQSGRQERVEPAKRRDYRNGFYERDYVTRVGTIRLLIARAREPNFAPTGLEKSQRRRAGRKSARCRWPTGTSGWQPAIAGLLAELRGESGCTGRPVRRPVPPGAGRQAPGADHDRCLPGSGGGHLGRLTVGAASEVLGAQDAKHSGEDAQPGLR